MDFKKNWPWIAIGGIGLYLIATKSGLASELGASQRVWPISPKRMDKQGNWKMSSFGAPRTRDDGSKRYHAGVDMLCFPGDSIVAMGDGVVLHMVSGYAIGNGLQAVAVDHGWAQLLYCEIRVDVKPGQHVSAGEKIGHADKNGDGNTMLHLEAWEKAPTRFTEWIPDKKPAGLLNIEEFLVGL